MERNLHYVSQFYLKEFVDPHTKCLWIYNKQNKEWKPSSPKKTASVLDYNALSKINEKYKYSFEEFTQKIEDKMARIFRDKICNKLQINAEDKSWIAHFIGLMHLNVPKRRSTFGKDIDSLNELLPEPNKIEKFTKNEKILFVVDNIEDIAKDYFNLKWSFLHSNNENWFITSDNPLHLFNNPNITPGLKVRGTEITLPLSRNICFTATVDDNQWLLHMEVESNVVEEMNRRRIKIADKILISGKKNYFGCKYIDTK